MENSTIRKFTEYKKNFNNDRDSDSDSDYLYDFEKIEEIIKKGIEAHPFLNLITTKFVTDTQNKIYSLSMPILSRTNTDNQERTPRNYVQDFTTFECAQINLDIRIPHSDMNKFAEFDFEQALNAELGGELARNLTMVGFHGTRRTADTDPENNPLGQDVAKGWHANLREKGQVLHASTLSGQSTAQLIKKALEKLPVRLRESGDLIAICGRDIIGDSLINLTAQELGASKGVLLIAQNLFCGLRAINVPYFPANGILITPLKNLAIYFQKNSSRLFFNQELREDTLKVYFSTKLDFLLENPAHAVLIESIEGAK